MGGQPGTYKATVDEIRIGTTQASVLPRGDGAKAAKPIDLAAGAADARLSAKLPMTWNKESIVSLNDKRGEVVLNGLWKFMPAVPGMSKPVNKGWGYIWVPESWKPRTSWRGTTMPGLAAKGQGRMWQNFNGKTLYRAWYERPIRGDLRWKTDTAAVLLANGCEIGADGQIGRKQIGKGVILFSQFDPNRYDADKLDYFRQTRWRQTRALAQVLGNLGVSFELDSHLSQLRGRREILLAGDWKARLVYSQTEPEKFDKTTQFLGGAIRPNALEILGVAKTADGNSVKSISVPDTADWPTVKVPADMGTYGPEWKDKDGEVVFQKVFHVPTDMADEDFTLGLSNIHQCDFAYINGKLVGKTGYETKAWWNFQRYYDVPARSIKPGRNVLTIVVQNDWRDGGLVGDADSIKLVPKRKGVEYYHEDYRTDYLLGDDPYRYHPW